MNSSSTHKKTASSLFAVILVLLIAVGFAAMPVYGATTGGEDDNRWVELEVSDTVDAVSYTTTLNLTVEELIPNMHTFNGEITHNVNDTYANTTATLEIAIQGETFNETVNLTESETASFSIGVTDLDEAENETIELTFYTTETEGAPDTWSGLVDIEQSTTYTVNRITNIIIALIPVLVLVAVVIPLIMGMMEEMAKEFEE